MRSATGQASNRATDSSHPREIALAIWTFVKKPTKPLADWKWKIVATFLAVDFQIVTGRAPFFPVRQYSSASGAELGEQMCQLMAQRAINLGRAKFVEPLVERNQLGAIIGPAGATFQPGIPFHVDESGEPNGVKMDQQLARFHFQSNVTTAKL
jgi:hypothetical protein